MEDRWHRDRGTYGHPCVVSEVWCLKGTLSWGRKWAAWVQTAEMNTVSLSADCRQSLTGAACGSRCLEQSDVIQQAENSPAMKNWPVPGRGKKAICAKKPHLSGVKSTPVLAC